MVNSLFAKHVIRKIFLEDWGLKLLALLITFGLWFGVTGLSSPTEEQLTVPLNLTISTDAVIMNVVRPEVDIVIKGDKRKLDQLTRSDLSALLDLTAVAPGDWVIPLTADTVYINNLPQGIKLENVRPINLAVKLEAVAEKDVEVRTETEGSVEPGYEVYSSSALPAKIRVRGPASVVDKLEYVQTDKIDLTGKMAEFTAKQIPVNAPNPKAAVLNTVVDVYFRIGEKRIEREFSVPVPGSPGKTATFTIYGPKTLVAKARSDAFKIDIGSYDTPQVVLPPELQDLVEVRRVKVK